MKNHIWKAEKLSMSVENELVSFPALSRWLSILSTLYGSSSTSSKRTTRPAVSTSHTIPSMVQNTARLPPTSSPEATPRATGTKAQPSGFETATKESPECSSAIARIRALRVDRKSHV